MLPESRKHGLSSENRPVGQIGSTEALFTEVSQQNSLNLSESIAGF